MTPLLIASRNPGKVSEMKSGLKPLGRRVLSLRDADIATEYAEDGATFEHNAIGKATFYGQLTEYDTIGDDGGICIDALNGEPGVHTRRWNGTEMTDDELIAYTLERLRGVPIGRRTATLITVLAYVPRDPDREPIVLRSALRGIIAETPYRPFPQGYPFRALFLVEEYNTYYAALTPEQHERVNQRRKVIAQLVQTLKPA